MSDEQAVPASVGADASRVVLGRGMLYTVGTAAPVLSNALVTPYVTRVLDRQAYGVVAVCLVVVQVGMILAGLGLAAAITRHGILEESGVGGARSLVLRGAGLSAGLCAAALITAPWWSPSSVPGEVLAVQVALVAAAGFAVVVNTQSYLRVLDRPAPFVVLSLVGALGGPLLGILLLALGRPTAATFLTGLALGYGVATLGAFALLGRGAGTARRRGDLRRALRIGLPTVPHQVALYLASGVLVLVASGVFGAAQSGRLQVAVLVGSAPGVITASLNNAWAPVVYRTPAEHRGDVLAHTGRDIALLTGLAAGFVSLAAPFLLRLAAPASFDRNALLPAVAWVAAGTVLSVPYLCNVHLVFVSGRSEGLAVLTPLSLVGGAGCAWVAARSVGLTATGTGMTVTYLLLAIGTAVLARYVSPTRWRMSTLGVPLLVGFALCAAGGLAPTGGVASLVRAVLAAGCAAGALAALWHMRRR